MILFVCVIFGFEWFGLLFVDVATFGSYVVRMFIAVVACLVYCCLVVCLLFDL